VRATANNIRGITVEINGETQGLQNALRDVNRQSTALQGELREVDRALRLDPSNVTLLSQRNQILANEVSNARDKLERLQHAQEQVEQQFANGDIGEEQYRAFQRELINTENGLNRLQNQLHESNDAMMDMGNAADNAANDTEQLRNSLNDVSNESDDAAHSGNRASDAIDDLGNSADNSESKLGGLAKGLGGIAKGAIAGIGAAVAGVGTAFLSSAEATQEWTANMSKLTTAATDAGYSTDFAKEKFTNLYGVLGDETAANTTVSNFMAMGASEENLNSLLHSASGIWAKYGDSIPLDGLAESINETAKVGKITGNLADALNWAGINEDEFNSQLGTCTSEQERQDKIAQTLSDTYGGLSSKYQENNKSIIEANEAEADYTDNMAQMGAKIEPATTAVKEGVNKLLEKMVELVNGVDIKEFVEKINQAFKVLTDKVLPAVEKGFKWIIDHKDVLIAGITGIATAFLAFKVVTIIQAVVTALEGMTLAQVALNIAMSLNPIGLIVAAIAGLVAAFIVLWNKCDWFREFWIGLWEKIKEIFAIFVEVFKLQIDAIKAVFETVKDFFSDQWETIKSIFSAVGGWFKDTFGPIFSGAMDGIKAIFGAVKDYISNQWELIKSVFSGIINFVKDVFHGDWSAAWEDIKGIFKSIWDSFEDIAKKPINAVIGLINGLIDGINMMIDGLNSIEITVPDWVPKVGGNSVGFNLSPLDGIQPLAKGGILSSGSAIFNENGPELLTMFNGKAIVQPLNGSVPKPSAMGGGNTYNITNNITANVSNDYDVMRLDNQLAALQSQKLKAIGG